MLLAHSAEVHLGWRPHPDVWLLILALTAGYIAAVRILGPRLVEPGNPVVTRAQVWFYGSGVFALWVGADWPMHELSENYLFSMHMVQHTLFSLVAPPLLLLGMPKWMLRLPLQNPRMMAVARFVTRPIVGLVLFNLVVVVTHWPLLVDAALRYGLVHFAVHVVLVVSAFIMWWPVIDRLPELSRLSPPGKMLYLFLQSIVPTVPASFLTFADGVIYRFYAEAPRLWSLDAVGDQRIAGLIMKIGGGLLLWTAIAILFFRWSAAEDRADAQEVSWEDFERSLQAYKLRQTQT